MDLAIQNFRGIRKVNPVVDVVSGAVLSAVTCRNTELRYTEKGNNVGIFTAAGNQIVSACPNKIIGQWESVQNRVTYRFVYAVDDTQGYIYLFDEVEGTYTALKSGLTVTGAANAITIANGFYDWFVFSNGVDPYIAINMQQKSESDRVKEIDAKDAEERTIRGLCLESYDGRLVTNCQNRIHWSKTQDIFTWGTSDPDLTTEPAYQELDRDVTAMAYYNNSLIVFTDSYSVAYTGNPGDATSFQRSGASGGGCASFKSVIKFDNKLFYFDAKAKNVFAYYLIDVGQTRPTNGLADNVIEFFDQIDTTRLDEIETVSFVDGDRSEIWFKLPYLNGDRILIYDYLKSEWVERQAEDNIRALMPTGSVFYSASGKNILREYQTSNFADEFIGAEYLANIINVGSDSNMKVPKMPLILTLDFNQENDFFIELTYDDNPERKQTKRVVKTSEGYLIWALSSDDENGGLWAKDKNDAAGGMWFDKNRNTVMFNLAGLRHFKQLQIRIYTSEAGQEFGIKRLELKRVKVKTKTLG